MTRVIAFHGSGSRTFKDFYTLQVLPNWKKAFPNKRKLQSFRGTNALVNDAVVLLLADEMHEKSQELALLIRHQ